jgi:hypothetical protein
MLTNEQKTLLRHDVLRFFAARRAVSFTSDSASHLMRVRRVTDVPFENDDLLDAAEVLVDLKLLKKYPDPLGSILYFQATGEGVIASERAQPGEG